MKYAAGSGQGERTCQQAAAAGHDQHRDLAGRVDVLIDFVDGIDQLAVDVADLVAAYGEDAIADGEAGIGRDAPGLNVRQNDAGVGVLNLHAELPAVRRLQGLLDVRHLRLRGGGCEQKENEVSQRVGVCDAADEELGHRRSLASVWSKERSKLMGLMGRVA